MNFEKWIYNQGIKEGCSSEKGGGFYFRDRIREVADWSCRFPGDLVEIGCYSGETSKILAEVAGRHGKRLLCVDNWNPKDPYYNFGKIKEEFDKRMGIFENVSVINGDAHNSSTINEIRRGRYCFALSDDGHEYIHHLAELIALEYSLLQGVIAVDDIHHEPDVKMAVADLTRITQGWKFYKESHLREAYLVR